MGGEGNTTAGGLCRDGPGAEEEAAGGHRGMAEDEDRRRARCPLSGLNKSWHVTAARMRDGLSS